MEIEHDGWVGGTLRHPASFVGMREDVPPRSVRREAAPSERLRATGDLWAPLHTTRGVAPRDLIEAAPRGDTAAEPARAR